MLDYIGDVPDYDEDSEDKEVYSNYDGDTAYLVRIIKSEIKRLEKMNV